MPGSDLISIGFRLATALDGVVAWLATYALHSTALILLALAVTAARSPWRLSIATRDVIWKAAIVGGVVTASLQVAVRASPVGGTWTLRRDVLSAQTRVNVVVAAPDAQNEQRATIRVAADGFRERAPHVLARPTLHGRQFAFAGAITTATAYVAGIALLWFAGVAFMAWRYERARMRLDRMLADRHPADHGIAGAVLREALRRAGVRRATRLTSSDRLESPAVLAPDEICVPRRFLREVTIVEQETILAHEVAHVVRRDAFWLRVANVVVHVFYFQPLNRLARGRLIEAAEFSADALAVRNTGEPLQLARALAAVATWLSPGTRITTLPAMASGRGSVLVRRVAELTRWQGGPARRGHRLPAALALATLAVAALVVPRVDLSRPLHAIDVRRLIVHERIDKADGSPATRLHVLDVALRSDSAVSGPPAWIRDGSRYGSAAVHLSWRAQRSAAQLGSGE